MGLARQLDALSSAGIPDERIYVDKKTGSTVDREGLNRMLAYARPGDTVVIRTSGRHVGRPVAHPEDKVEYARPLKAQGESLGKIAAKTGTPKTSLHRYLEPSVEGQQ